MESKGLNMENKITKFENIKKLPYKVPIDSSKIQRRVRLSNFAKHLFSSSVLLAVVVLGFLLFQVIRDSIGWLDMDFLTKTLSIFPEKAGIKGAIMGTV